MPGPTAVDLLWGEPRRPKRGPKPALSLEGIVEAAIELGDSEGLAGVSMQRVAERLGFTKMSLYRYVPGKAELNALMLDAGLGAPPELPVGPPPEPWRDGLRLWCETIHERFSAHPWGLELAIGIRPIGPNEMAWMESALVALADSGLPTHERLDTIALLAGHARGLARQPPGAQNDDFQEHIAAQFAAMAAAAARRFPAATAAFAEAGAMAGGDGALRFGIDRILDGLAVHIARRRGGDRPIVGT